jgi:hypothetical protein
MSLKLPVPVKRFSGLTRLEPDTPLHYGVALIAWECYADIITPVESPLRLRTGQNPCPSKVFYALFATIFSNMSFYTKERWSNWLKQVDESNFTIDDDREGLGPEGIVFLNMEEDIILALCKLTGMYQKGTTTQEDARNALDEMEGWIFSDAYSMESDKDAMFRSVQTALFAAFGGARKVLEGEVKKGDDIANLIVEADNFENNGKDEEAFKNASMAAGAAFCGARFKSDKLLDRITGSLVMEWADGIDTIQDVLKGGVDLSVDADDGK